jgi:tetratricopeptide (TPR) repeat protein
VALGKAYLRDGKVSEAVKQLQEAARLAPGNGEARYQLGLALARSGRKEEATSELSKGRELVTADDRDKTASLDLLEGRAALEKGELEGGRPSCGTRSSCGPTPSRRRAPRAVLEKQGNVAGRAPRPTRRPWS